jgi:hydroxymethylpyrimidine/phosphomethylpyrimidine kinase
MTPRVALTIAGSDSGGGAGLQADLKTFAAFGVHGTCAVTAVTAQSSVTVAGVVRIDPAFVDLQVRTVTADLSPDAAKSGMLVSAATVETVAALCAAGLLPNLVVDPVLVSSTGHRLMDEEGVAAYREHLLPWATVATPNLREAAVLTGVDVAELMTVAAMIRCAEELRDLGAHTVVVKGGHFADAGQAPDVVAGPDGTTVLEAARVDTGNDHGTGCSLSAAITAGLALGRPVPEAIQSAKEFVRRALEGAAPWRLGAGHGPIDHFGWGPGPPDGS